jgi:arylsulfatase
MELDEVGPRTLIATLRANPALPENLNQSVELSVNGSNLGRFPVARTWVETEVPVPSEVLVSGPNRFRAVFEHGLSPKETGSARDSRTIAARVKSLKLRSTTGGRHVGNNPATSRDVWDDRRRALIVEESGTLVIPLLVPDDAGSLVVAARTRDGAGPTSIEASITTTDLDESGATAQTLNIGRDRERRTTRISVSDSKGRWLLAMISIEMAEPSGGLEIFPPSFEPDPRSEPGRSIDRQVRSQNRPDIVLITLDAARADRFSFSGNPRATTPRIDELARESLIFPQAYALAPYTLCSVPTMITGLSFLDHGVVLREDVLSQQAVTLAETLKGLGYQTVAFSATPNNSIAKGFAQGYDEFREMWKEGARSRNRRAGFIARRVVEWLDAQTDDDRPLHLQVHMVPPHVPYDPEETFDLFTDPLYDGPCIGEADVLRRLESGELDAKPECLENLLALYDGNLRSADHATGLILDALRRRPRWDNTVVLITSDHGDAFMEHGWMGHNASVYSEMLHVPFVLRVPSSTDCEDVATDGLVSLADITPTLLGLGGMPPAAWSDGYDLLAPEQRRDGRFVVTRNAESEPAVGLRTSRWSLMISSDGRPELFNLHDDPLEQRNVAFRSATVFFGLDRVLNRRLAVPKRFFAADQHADLTDDERELLKTLGYLSD